MLKSYLGCGFGTKGFGAKGLGPGLDNVPTFVLKHGFKQGDIISPLEMPNTSLL